MKINPRLTMQSSPPYMGRLYCLNIQLLNLGSSYKGCSPLENWECGGLSSKRLANRFLDGLTDSAGCSIPVLIAFS